MRRRMRANHRMAQLFIGIVTGALGFAYIVYGRRQQRFAPLLCGIALCAYPYFIDSTLVLWLVGAALAAVPFVVDL